MIRTAFQLGGKHGGERWEEATEAGQRGGRRRAQALPTSVGMWALGEAARRGVKGMWGLT